jgi:hypothetical protein
MPASERAGGAEGFRKKRGTVWRDVKHHQQDRVEICRQASESLDTAVGVPTGKIAIAWTVDRGRPDPVLQFSWVERGGPPAGPPLHRGSGTDLLGAVGRPELLYSSCGFEYRVELSLDEALG